MEFAEQFVKTSEDGYYDRLCTTTSKQQYSSIHVLSKITININTIIDRKRRGEKKEKREKTKENNRSMVNYTRRIKEHIATSSAWKCVVDLR